ncbi:hypothetical protein HaLaN_17783 [Haematococcus lacustris]|uniref:Uncharacterized protein n=1 Tax=Haematococcus lacustris TaxID=44745 RepID=A0A699ZXE4_HAELA|nr:hypothetical protein HaLaN_17783 [Haematococcus lacustris]
MFSIDAMEIAYDDPGCLHRRRATICQGTHEGYGPTARVPMVKSEADVSAPAEQPQMALLMPQPLPLNEATSFVGLWKAMVGEDTDPVRCERAYAWLLCNCKSQPTAVQL